MWSYQKKTGQLSFFCATQCVLSTGRRYTIVRSVLVVLGTHSFLHSFSISSIVLFLSVVAVFRILKNNKVSKGYELQSLTTSFGSKFERCFSIKEKLTPLEIILFGNFIK